MSSQCYVFSSGHVCMWELDHKKAENWGTDVFGLWCWRRLLRIPWTARRSNQSILKEISPEYSLEGLMLKLKLQNLVTWCEELTHWKRPWCWERLKAGGEGDDRGWDGWVVPLTRWTWVWASSRSSWWTEKPGLLQSLGSQRVGHHWVTELNWTEGNRSHYQRIHVPQLSHRTCSQTSVPMDVLSLFLGRDNITFGHFIPVPLP